MPAKDKFAQAFQLRKTLFLKGLSPVIKIQQIELGHTPVKAYVEYVYPIQIHMTLPLTVDQQRQVITFIQTHKLEHKTVESQYHNPYDCFLDLTTLHFDETGQVLTLTGRAFRLFKNQIPDASKDS